MSVFTQTHDVNWRMFDAVERPLWRRLVSLTVFGCCHSVINYVAKFRLIMHSDLESLVVLSWILEVTFQSHISKARLICCRKQQIVGPHFNVTPTQTVFLFTTNQTFFLENHDSYMIKIFPQIKETSKICIANAYKFIMCKLL